VLSDQAVRYMSLAAQADSAGNVSPSDGGPDPSAVAIGRELLRVIFGHRRASVSIPDEFAALAAHPANAEAFTAVWDRVNYIFEADPRVKSAAAGILAAFFRRESDAGDTQALIALGDLLRYQHQHEEARDAYRRAADAGNSHARIALARELAYGLGDFDGARMAYREAIGGADPEVAAEALVQLGYLLASEFRDNAAAEAAFREAIRTGHSQWAPAATMGLAYLREQQGDLDAACYIYQEMIDDASPEAAHAAVVLGEILEDRGDIAGAKAGYWRAIDSGTGAWAAHALVNLLNILEQEGDLEGVREAHHRAVQTGNSDASYGLIVTGQMLQDRGDAEGARAAFEQARATGVDAYPTPDGF